jgi:PAS domain S-box-containing protein
MDLEISQLLSLILDQAQNDYIIVINRDFEIVYANQSFKEHFAPGQPDITGRRCYDLFQQDQESCGIPHCGLEDCLHLDGPQDRILTRLSFDGREETFEAFLYPIRDPQGEVSLFAEFFRRLSHREILTQAIERIHTFQGKLIQTSMDGIIASDRFGNIIIFNDGAEKILGYKKQEVLGKIKVHNFYPPGMPREVKKKLYSPEFGGPGRLVQFETLVVNKSGEEIPIELSASLICDGSEEMATVGIFRDLRERRQLQERLLQSERLAVLGRMAAHISHEIKSPLMVIGGFARQVRNHLAEEPEKNRERLQIIINEVARLEDFLAETGSYAKLSEPQRAPGDLNALIREVGDLLEPHLTEQQVEFTLNLARKLPSLRFDPGHLRQVFLNLMKNSLEAMPRGGCLTVTTSRRGDRVEVQLDDTGEGISPESLEKIFMPFFSTKPKGTGLGLAICQKIMEAHQGDIAIASEPRQGTRVTLTFKAPGRP